MLIKLFLAFLMTPVAAFAHTTKPCDRLGAAPRPTLREIRARLDVMEASNTDYIVRSEVELKRFWREGYVELQQLARKSGTTVFDILNGYYDQIAFLTENVGEYDPSAASSNAHIKEHREELRTALAQLEGLGPRDNLKRRHWQSLGVVYSAIYKLMVYLFEYMRATHKLDMESPVDPFSPYTPNQIHTLFEELEKLTIDRTLNFAVNVTESYRRREEERLEKLTAPRLHTAGSAPAVVTEPSVADLPSVPVHAVDPVPHVQEPLDLSSLATVLKEDLPLRHSFIYRAHVVRNMGFEEFAISLEPELTREDSSADRKVLRRLLRAIFTPSQSTGIVHMGSLGPGIIEVRAYLRGGHKRIIGCLEGRMVTLKYLVDIPANGNSYAREINPNLCR